VNVVKLLLRRKFLIGSIDDWEKPLIEAANNGHGAIVKLLSEKAAYINVKGTLEWLLH
jgi:hypothetical protein